MTRSEMLNIIIDVYKKTLKYKGLVGRNSDMILNAIEKAGMLPPNKKGVYMIPYKSEEARFLLQGFIQNHRWEPESNTTEQDKSYEYRGNSQLDGTLEITQEKVSKSAIDPLLGNNED